MIKNQIRVAGWLVVLLSACLGCAGAQETPVRVAAKALRPLDGSITCPVSRQSHRNHLFAARYRGRIYYTCDEEALRKFLKDPDAFARNMEPRSGLFHSPDPSRPMYGFLVFGFGVYVVIALLCGALAAYVAVQKGLNGSRWFAAGCALNVLGVGLAYARPAREMRFHRRGLAKIPTTHEPVPCPDCGTRNHPSGGRCVGCGAALRPAVESEVDRAKKTEGP